MARIPLVDPRVHPVGAGGRKCGAPDVDGIGCEAEQATAGRAAHAAVIDRARGRRKVD